ncbi:hypothetical protein SBX64_07690 [Vibrio rhizosphaerae]|uniref:Uncharacterized protein n=1 Tax=Vibrio rhizosphaerae TaxID=398736 RepID=A0ABU4ISQ9_9VIBR|nr:hypothetical protein [Vibrio rhizosphaerae]MDW6092425.1 hypothetical protein [Vibrio rhizosphaerae]
MADYECWCLWSVNPSEGMPYNIDPKTLPLSKELLNRLSAWEDKFDATLVRDNPIDSGFKTKEEAILFNDEGWKLFDALKNEMPMVEFYYFDNELSELLKEKP